MILENKSKIIFSESKYSNLNYLQKEMNVTSQFSSKHLFQKKIGVLMQIIVIDNNNILMNVRRSSF
jgi:hypothetical protein